MLFILNYLGLKIIICAHQCGYFIKTHSTCIYSIIHPQSYRHKKNSVSSGIRVFKINKTRGLRRWPTRETIVLRCNKLNPGSTEIFEINVRNSDLFGASLPTSKKIVHKNSERYLIQSWIYP